MSVFSKMMAAVMLTAWASTVFAGSPGGLQLVVVGTAKAAAQKSAIEAFFQRYDPGTNNADCENTQLKYRQCL
jgi:hypothetical protein